MNKDEIYAEFWLHGDYWEQERRKGIKCAEVLVPHDVRPDLISGAYVANDMALNKLSKVSNITVIKNSSLFF